MALQISELTGSRFGARVSGISPGQISDVSDLRQHHTEQDLEVAFSRFGALREVVVMRHQETGEPRGFGFVTFAEHEQAMAAVASGFCTLGADQARCKVVFASPRPPPRGGPPGSSADEDLSPCHVCAEQDEPPADALEIAVTNALAAFVRATPRARKNLPRDRSSEAYIDANVAVSRAFASLALDEDAFAPFLAHAMESLRARFTMQRLPPPETFLERSSASCTGDVAADELRTGARTRVAIQMRGGVCVLHDDPYLSLIHI